MSKFRLGERGVYGCVLAHARPYWLHITGILLVDLLASPLGLLTPRPLKIVVDSAIGNHPIPYFLSMFLPARAAQSR